MKSQTCSVRVEGLWFIRVLLFTWLIFHMIGKWNWRNAFWEDEHLFKSLAGWDSWKILDRELLPCNLIKYIVRWCIFALMRLEAKDSCTTSETLPRRWSACLYRISFDVVWKWNLKWLANHTGCDYRNCRVISCLDRFMWLVTEVGKFGMTLLRCLR